MEGRPHYFKIIRLIMLLGLLTALTPAGALTLSELRAQARVLALDAGTTRQRYTDARVTAFLNEGQRAVVVEARPLLQAGTLELVAGTTYYDLPGDFLQMHRVTHDWEVLPEQTPEALDRSSQWQITGAEPTHYYVHFASRTKVGFYPFPESSSSTGTVRYEYWAQATAMSADGDEPYNGVTELLPYHDGLAYYAAARMTAIDGRPGLASFYLSEHRATVERMKSEAKSRPSYRPGASGSPPR